MGKSIKEKDISGLWEFQPIHVMEADTGARVQVLYPGRGSTRPGCDFQDAVLLIDDEKVYGDVEIHVTSDLWHCHGHHRDPVYNNIVLHVAMWQRGGLPAIVQNGNVIPTVILSQYLSGYVVHNPNSIKQTQYGCSYIDKQSSRGTLYKILHEAGSERFKQKVNKFKVELQREDHQQVLYRYIARALGYARNTTPFEALSQKLPIKFITRNLQENIISLQAYLFGVSGLLPSQRNGNSYYFIDEETSTLEHEWSARIAMLQQLQEWDWCFHGTRPENHPARRLAALSFLLERYSRQGLVPGLLELLEEAPPGSESNWIEKGLIIEGTGYWGNHYDFCVCREKCSALLGKGKAAEIVVNVILPYFISLALVNQDVGLICKAIDIYNDYHALPENDITRYMKSMLLPIRAQRLTACEQQGLLHIYHSHCRQKDCRQCPVFKFPERDRG
ncbi:MAG: DUF2851 family protein [Chloroflexi bacterium]|nr:DUF2851 family protein [Chloroflexota bacterium]